MLSIRYRDFYDVPRAFIVERTGSLFLFDCPFNEELDDYPESYAVYRIDSELSGDLDDGSWNDLAARGTFLGEIPVKRVRFDATGRSTIDEEVFATLPGSL